MKTEWKLFYYFVKIIKNFVFLCVVQPPETCLPIIIIIIIFAIVWAQFSLSSDRLHSSSSSCYVSMSLLLSFIQFFVAFSSYRYVIVPFCDSCSPSKRFVNFITWLGYVNSVLNPVIYTIFNLEYRRAFKKLLGIKR